MFSHFKRKTKQELLGLAIKFIASRDYADFVELTDHMGKYMPVKGNAGIKVDGRILWDGLSDDFSIMISMMLQNRIVFTYPTISTFYLKKYKNELPQKLLKRPLGQYTQKYGEDDPHWVPCVLSTKYPDEWITFLKETKVEGLKHVY